VLALPEAAWLPLQAPPAVQLSALVADQLRVADWPDWIAVGSTLMLTTGAGTVPTFSVTVPAPPPPGPVQLRM
jgi:hypothetical protein